MRSFYPKPHFLPEDCEIPSKEYVFMGYDAGATMHVSNKSTMPITLFYIWNIIKNKDILVLLVGLYKQTNVASSTERNKDLVLEAAARMREYM